MQKLYCYVDESGQDTRGKIFIVSVVITATERETLLSLCERIERESGKGNRKWHSARPKPRLEYLTLIFGRKEFRGKLYYSAFQDTTNYDLATIVAIARVINTQKPKGKYTTLVYVDALTKAQKHKYGPELRKLGIPTRKIQGITRETSNALIRLADAIAGFVRDATGEHINRQTREFFEKAKKNGSLIEA